MTKFDVNYLEKEVNKTCQIYMTPLFKFWVRINAFCTNNHYLNIHQKKEALKYDDKKVFNIIIIVLPLQKLIVNLMARRQGFWC